MTGSSDDAIIQQADDIAVQITGLLVGAFKAKEGRDPTPEEVEQLIEEMTVERIEELMSGKESQSSEQGLAGEEAATGNIEEEDSADDAESDDEREKKGIVTEIQSVPDSFTFFMRKTEEISASKIQSSPTAVAEDCALEGDSKRRRLDTN